MTRVFAIILMLAPWLGPTPAFSAGGSAEKSEDDEITPGQGNVAFSVTLGRPYSAFPDAMMLKMRNAILVARGEPPQSADMDDADTKKSEGH